MTDYTVVLVVPAVIIFFFSLILNIMSIQKYNQKKNAVYNKSPLDLYAVNFKIKNYKGREYLTKNSQTKD